MSQTHYPINPEPRDVPWNKKVSGYYAEDREYFEAQSAEDWLGNRFSVGEAVLYCIAAGRGQMVALGEVLGIRYYVEQNNLYYNPQTEKWQHFNGGRIWSQESRQYEGSWEVRADPKDHVEVQIQTAVTSGNWGNEKRSRPGWANPMNITALGDATVPAMVKKVLDARA